MFDNVDDQFHKRVLIVPEGKPFSPGDDWMRKPEPVRAREKKIPAIAMNTDRLQGATISPRAQVEIAISDRSQKSQQAT